MELYYICPHITSFLKCALEYSNIPLYCLDPTWKFASRSFSGSKFAQVGCCVMDGLFPKGTINGPLADATA